MKKVLFLLFLVGSITIIPTSKASAQFGWIEDIIKRAIMAIDLGVQKAQQKTIALQNVQKKLENNMAKLHLDDITNWVQKQKDLYQEYYQELWQIKNAITYYSRVKDIINKQIQLVSDYKKAYALVGKDAHFTSQELVHIRSVYDGILKQSIANIDEIETVINAFITQMDDAERLKIIDHAEKKIDGNYYDLKKFTQENALLSLQRSKSESELDMIKILYGIE